MTIAFFVIFDKNAFGVLNGPGSNGVAGRSQAPGLALRNTTDLVALEEDVARFGVMVLHLPKFSGARRALYLRVALYAALPQLTMNPSPRLAKSVSNCARRSGWSVSTLWAAS